MKIDKDLERAIAELDTLLANKEELYNSLSNGYTQVYRTKRLTICILDNTKNIKVKECKIKKKKEEVIKMACKKGKGKKKK